MKKNLIGVKRFEGCIDITDPCYSKDVWCRHTTKDPVQPGNYHCIIRTKQRQYTYEGKMHRWQSTISAGIYLDGVMPSRGQMSVECCIGVDAGMAGFFVNKPDYNDEQWHEFCSRVREGRAWILDEGFCASTGGDGAFPVFSKRNKKGEIVALEIEIEDY